MYISKIALGSEKSVSFILNDLEVFVTYTSRNMNNHS